jgi:hypothetical protein
VHVAVKEPGANGGDKERRDGRPGTEPVAVAGVDGERLNGACVQRNFSGLPKLGVADLKYAFVHVDIVAVESEGPADAKSGYCQ